jgi:plastocyanin|tara:strand:- start:2982 stop:3440 length:459 start_codon:yes stop_codon:yes gene_type:complete
MLCGNIGLINEDGVEHTIIVDGTNLRFSPDSLTINEGDSVRFVWDGELLPHNSVEENGVFNSGDPERDVDYLYTFNYTQSGIYDFFCEPHEDVGMIGEITVINIEQEEIVEESLIDITEEGRGFPIITIFLLFLVVFLLYKARVVQPENILK